MQISWRERSLAMAGIAQAVDLVDQLARTGYLNTRDFETCVYSLFQQNPASVDEVYGGVQNLKRGLEVLLRLLAEKKSPERGNQIVGYCLGVVHLQQRLGKTPRMLNRIGERLGQAKNQLEHFGATHDNVIANLADIYTETISTFPFRIQVAGEYQYLQQQRVANQIRVLLFAAIRSAMLWRQVGGNRWQLLFHRKKVTEAAQQMLSSMHG